MVPDAEGAAALMVSDELQTGVYRGAHLRGPRRKRCLPCKTLMLGFKKKLRTERRARNEATGDVHVYNTGYF